MFCSKWNFMLIPYLENDNNNLNKIRKASEIFKWSFTNQILILWNKVNLEIFMSMCVIYQPLRCVQRLSNFLTLNEHLLKKINNLIKAKSISKGKKWRNFNNQGEKKCTEKNISTTKNKSYTLRTLKIKVKLIYV